MNIMSISHILVVYFWTRLCYIDTVLLESTSRKEEAGSGGLKWPMQFLKINTFFILATTQPIKDFAPKIRRIVSCCQNYQCDTTLATL